MNPKELLNIAQNNPNGFTVDLEWNHIAEGFAVARIETQNSFGVTGAEKVLKSAPQNNCYIGGWLDMKSGQYYFDAVDVTQDETEALVLPVER